MPTGGRVGHTPKTTVLRQMENKTKNTYVLLFHLKRFSFTRVQKELLKKIEIERKRPSRGPLAFLYGRQGSKSAAKQYNVFLLFLQVWSVRNFSSDEGSPSARAARERGFSVATPRCRPLAAGKCSALAVVYRVYRDKDG